VPAYIDVDEWRDAPLRHRYVHGGFEGTHTRFSFYFPPADQYGGRFVQFLEGGPGGNEHYLEHTASIGGGWPFTTAFLELGAYVVESNQGHFANEGNVGTSGDVELFGASAESAVHSKVVAEEMYGAPPHHGYVFGGSGGGLRSIACIEHRPDVWDGAVPFMIGEASGSPMSFALAYWWLYCRDARDAIIDAIEPGGSGDPFATLDHDQRQALATLYRAGWNRGAENQIWNSGSWMYGFSNIRDSDPTYFDDFWSVPGYLGHDAPERLASVLVDETSTVTAVHDGLGPGSTWLPRIDGGDDSATAERGRRFGIELGRDDDPNRRFMCRVTVLTGAAAGREVYVNQDGAVLIGERMTVPDMFDGVEVGDEVRVDNRELIAFAHRWMYWLDLDVWAEDDPATGERTLAPEFRGLGATMVDGVPAYPQRPRRTTPPSQTGRAAKMIHYCGTFDTIVPLPSVATYGRRVRSVYGDAADDHYRLWFVEHAPHGTEDLLAWISPEKDVGVWRSRLVGYGGMTDYAVKAMIKWVEDDVPPPPTTSYRYTDDSGLVLAPTAAERHGVQPVVRAQANGGLRADVRVGEPVSFTGTAEQPPGVGTIVSARWDFEGRGDFSFRHDVDGTTDTIKVETTHAYDTPGTYFASFRAGANPFGAGGPGQTIDNGARVRVVVT
jgi:hypothetical protein